MAHVLPIVRHILVCDDIRIDSTNRQKVSLINLLSTIRSVSEPTFPHLYPELCVYIQLTECRGVGDVRLQIEEADTNTSIFETPTRTILLGNDPLKRRGLSFRVRDLLFPSPGLYLVGFWYNNLKLVEETLLLE